MKYSTEAQNSTHTTVYAQFRDNAQFDDGSYLRPIGHIKKVAWRIYSAARGPYDLGTFESIDAAKEAIIHEYNRPLNMEQCAAWNNRTGIYALPR